MDKKYIAALVAFLVVVAGAYGVFQFVGNYTDAKNGVYVNAELGASYVAGEMCTISTPAGTTTEKILAAAAWCASEMVTDAEGVPAPAPVRSSGEAGSLVPVDEEDGFRPAPEEAVPADVTAPALISNDTTPDAPVTPAAP